MSFLLRLFGFSTAGHSADPKNLHNSQPLVPSRGGGGVVQPVVVQSGPVQAARTPIRRKDRRPTEGCRPHTLEEFCCVDERDISQAPSQLSILFFAGKSVNAGITRAAAFVTTHNPQASEFSHVGIAHLWQGGLIGVFESVRAADPLPDALTGLTNKTGVRLVQLRDKLIYYASKGEFEWEVPHTGERIVKVGLLRFHLLQMDPSHDMQTVQNMLYERFSAFQRMESSKTFSQSALEMAKAGAPELFGENQTNTHEYFCSSLVAKTFVALGALPETYPISSETPGSLATLTLPVLSGAEFSDELIIAYISIPRTSWDPTWIPPLHHQASAPSPFPSSHEVYSTQPPPALYPQVYQQQATNNYYSAAQTTPAAVGYDGSSTPALSPPIAPMRASELYAQQRIQLPPAHTRDRFNTPST